MVRAAGQEADQGREEEVQGGGGDVEGTPAPQHCQILQLLRGHQTELLQDQSEEIYCLGHRVNDVWHTESLSQEI